MRLDHLPHYLPAERLLRLILPCVGLCIGLAACATQAIMPVETDATAFESWNNAPPAYRFGPGDRIRVAFALTPEAGEDSTVGPDGFIGIRVAGRVRAQGMTAEQLQDAITTASRRNLRNPIVTVSLAEAGSARVIVGGQVAHPGVYPLVGRDSPFEAVVLAGGFLPDSRTDQVVVIRRNADNRPMLRTVNLQSYINTGDANAGMPLQPGDVVFVPRTHAAEWFPWFNK